MLFKFYHMCICYLFIILLYLFEIVDKVLYYELFMYLSFLTFSTSRGIACQKRSMEQIKHYDDDNDDDDKTICLLYY
jgi:hypothetical protein